MSERLPIKITKRMQKGAAGNWGHPNKFEKQHTKVELALEDIVPHIHSKKKKRVNKKPYIFPRDACPFCGEELPIDEKKQEEQKRNGEFWALFHPRIDTCPNCECYRVNQCPSCKRETWFNPKTKLYKHQGFQCGFNGKKKSS